VKTETKSPEKTSLVGVERTVRILQALEQAESANLADISRITSLNEATVLRYLTTLGTLGFIERQESGRYRLGWEVYRLGRRALESRVPREAVRPTMEALRAEFKETVNLAYRKDDEVVVVEVLEGTRAIKKISDVGQSDPWHASALGKALMATGTDAEWRRLLERVGTPRLTEHTITSMAALSKEIAETRERGFAIDREESDEDLTCVAAAIATPAGMEQLAISVSFLTHRLPEVGIDEAGRRIVEAAREISLRLR
jgi:IclR family transcriptional regulator, acetate operon repressor